MSGPCEGLTVVELTVGTSELGLGLAGAAPGRLLADLGADVTRIVGPEQLGLDRDLTWSEPWQRSKRTLVLDEPDEIRSLLAGVDVVFAYGPGEVVEARGLGYQDLQAANPRLVHVRCRPSRTSAGELEDFGLLVEARSGFCSQLAGHRPGPIFVDVRAPGSGAAFLMTTTALALLHRRARTGTGGWAETSLYDGMLATLGCMIGRSERAPEPVESYWEHGSTFPNFLYRCSDGELVQVWFGGKGMYASLLEVLGDEPSEQGYYADQVTGALNERAVRWRTLFAARPRDEWIGRLRAVGVACEPVLAPGDALRDPHLAEVGLAVPGTDHERRQVVVGSPIAVEPLVEHGPTASDPGRPLAGLRVADFSAFVAGPLAAQVLADLGADVIKVEPPGGEAMRAAAYAVAACQRGKRSLALDIGSPDSLPVVERLLGWADVVLHNFRVGVSTRLGIDEERVGELRPDAVYCHASGFGPAGPRARLPGNDALMQALTGFERAVGGEGNDPVAGTWIPIDMSGGWIGAIGALAGLYARATTGRGQRVCTSLLGAGMLLHSGVHERDGELVPGPQLDRRQTGYGPGYRIYEAGDGGWFALVVPDDAAWARLREVVGASELTDEYVPLRREPSDPVASDAEAVLERVFAAAPVDHWVDVLRDAGALVEPVVEVDRDGFRRGILDDPVNRQLGRVATYETREWGSFEQIGPLLRHGPDGGPGPRLALPGVGEHTVEVLEALGVDDETIVHLLGAGVAVQLDA